MSDDRVAALEQRVEELTRSLEAMQMRLTSVASAESAEVDGAPVSRRHALRAAGVLAAGAIAGGIGAMANSTQAAATPTVTPNSFGETADGAAAIYAEGNTYAKGLDAHSASAAAVYGRTTDGYGLFGTASGVGTGVWAHGTNGYALYAIATNAHAIVAQAGDHNAVYASSAGNAIMAESTGDETAIAVWGMSSLAAGVYGQSNSNVGVSGHSNTSVGVSGSNNGTGAAVQGYTLAGTGILGISSTGAGISGRSTTGQGVAASSTSGIAASATTSSTINPAFAASNSIGTAVDTSGVTGVRGVGNSLNGVAGVGVFGQAYGEDCVGVIAQGYDGVAISASRAAIKLNATAIQDVPSLTPRAGELVLDASGQLWFASINGWTMLAGTHSGTAFTPIAPARVYDSRAPLPDQGVMANNSNRTVSVADQRGDSGAVSLSDVVPPGAKAIAANVTVTGTTGTNFLCVNPGGITTRPASTINWFGSGQKLANGVVLTLDTNRRVTIVSGNGGGTAHVIIDVSGYWL